MIWLNWREYTRNDERLEKEGKIEKFSLKVEEDISYITSRDGRVLEWDLDKKLPSFPFTYSGNFSVKIEKKFEYIEGRDWHRIFIQCSIWLNRFEVNKDLNVTEHR